MGFIGVQGLGVSGFRGVGFRELRIPSEILELGVLRLLTASGLLGTLTFWGLGFTALRSFWGVPRVSIVVPFLVNQFYG